MSGNGNHGTVNGATLGTDRFGEENKAYSFDGVDDYVPGGNCWMVTDGSYYIRMVKNRSRWYFVYGQLLERRSKLVLEFPLSFKITEDFGFVTL